MTSLEIGEADAQDGFLGEEVAHAPRPLRADVWRRFRRNGLAMVGLVLLVVIVLAAVFAGWVAPSGVNERVADARLPPSADHWFGTDRIGRDMFSRVVYGARVSLRIGFLAAGLSLLIGVAYGAVSGFIGGIMDTLMMRVVDMFLAIPYVVLAVAIATAVGRSENSVILILGFTTWPGISRVVRSSFLSLKQLEYAEAAQALGLRQRRIILRHLLPNALQPIIVYGTISVGTVILTEAALSFLGVGPQAPTPAWGLMVSEGKSLLGSEPWILLFPGGAIFVTVLAFVFVGDGLRDALDPKLK